MHARGIERAMQFGYVVMTGRFDDANNADRRHVGPRKGAIVDDFVDRRTR